MSAKRQPRRCAECGAGIAPARLRAHAWLFVQAGPGAPRVLYCSDCQDAALDALTDDAKAWAVLLTGGRVKLVELRRGEDAAGRSHLRRVCV